MDITTHPTITTGRWLLLAAAGLGMLVLGLVWDAAMHAADPTLAAEEGPLTLTNPSHPDRVAQIVANLIDNARRYAATTVTVRVATDPHPTIEVADDGPGVPPRERSAMLPQVAGASRTAARSAPGSGVGLAIVAELAAAMGAKLSVTNSPPRRCPVRGEFPNARTTMMAPS